MATLGGKDAMLHSKMLRYLDEVARCGSMRKAGGLLNVSPSAINRQIIALEAELGLTLFERLPRHLRLTAAGEILIGHIRQTLKEHQRTKERLEDLKGAHHAKTTLGTMSGLAGGILADLLDAFRRERQRSHLVVQVMSASDIVAAVAAGEVDVAFAFNLPADPAVRTAAAANSPIGAAMAPDHPLASREHIRIGDLRSYPLILPMQGIFMRDLLDQAFASAGLVAAPVIESNSFDFMKRLALLGHGVAILNRIDVDEQRRLGKLVFVPLRDPRFEYQVLMVAHRARGMLDPLTNVLVERLSAFTRGFGTDVQ